MHDLASGAARDRPNGEETPPKGDRPEPASPALRGAWFLRVAGVAGVVAAIVGVLVAPGMAGNAGDVFVEPTQKISTVLSAFVGIFLMELTLWGSLENVRLNRGNAIARGLMLIGSAVVVVMAGAALSGNFPAGPRIVLGAGAVVATLAGAANALGAAQTRAVGVILGGFGVAAMLRLVAWGLNWTNEGEHPLHSDTLAGLSTGLSTAGVVFEGLGQLVAAAWLGTRGKLGGQLLSSVAIAAAFVLTWGAAHGHPYAHPDAALWKRVLHSSLMGERSRPPETFGLDAVAIFLICAAVLLALVAVVQTGQVVVIVCALGLALLSRGAFDSPMRAMAAVAAAQWITVAMGDDRAMWRSLLDARNRKLGVAPPAAARAPARESEADVEDEKPG